MRYVHNNMCSRFTITLVPFVHYDLGYPYLIRFIQKKYLRF